MAYMTNHNLIQNISQRFIETMEINCVPSNKLQCQIILANCIYYIIEAKLASMLFEILFQNTIVKF